MFCYLLLGFLFVCKGVSKSQVIIQLAGDSCFRETNQETPRSTSRPWHLLLRQAQPRLAACLDKGTSLRQGCTWIGSSLWCTKGPSPWLVIFFANPPLLLTHMILLFLDWRMDMIHHPFWGVDISPHLLQCRDGFRDHADVSLRINMEFPC